MIRLIWLIVCFFLASIANGQLNCFTLRPSTISGLSPQPDSSNPYVIEVSSQSYTPGDVITVTITTNQEDPFTEVYVAAAHALDKRTYIGNWVQLEQSETYCDDDTVIGYTTTTAETVKTFTWQLPMDKTVPAGGFIFRATVVQDATTYWGPNVESAVIQVSTGTFQCPENACNNGQCVPFDETGFFCMCDDGYTGLVCDEQITEPNPCDSGPCQNEASCTAVDGQGFSCQCPAGYTGLTCEMELAGPCDSNPCQNDATCLDVSILSIFICICADGFTGTTCEEEDPCAPDTCANGGSWFNLEIDACVPNPCLNGASCISSGANFFCRCLGGFTGLLCNTVEPNPCDSGPCQNEASCTAVDGQGFSCQCPAGYTGLTCEMAPMINPCDNIPCENGGTCFRLNDQNRFCQCPDGFSGESCEIPTAEPNPCDSTPCQNEASCTSVDGQGFSCQCPAGYTGLTCDMELATPCSSNPCRNGASCREILTMFFVCICADGFTGTTCEGVLNNPCDSQPCRNGGTCNRGTGLEYTCSCTSDFQGMNCSDAVHPCDDFSLCQNGGTCNRGTGLEFSCTCTSGFEGTNCEVAVNPCDSEPCLNGGTCNRGTGLEYTCSCTSSFQGMNCSDAVNPCDSEPCLNGGTCNRGTGLEYNCTCTSDFRGINCSDAVHPCDFQPCENGGTCNRVTGLEYNCSCTSGFEGTDCDVAVPNPCDSEPCLNGGTCDRTTSLAYTCSCMDGFAGMNCNDTVNDPCESQPCRNGGTCIKEGDVEYTCTCTGGFDGTNCDVPANPCILQPCENDGTCINLDGGNFNCSCLEGFTGETCEIDGALLTTSAFTTEELRRCEPIDINDAVITCNERNGILAEMCTLECSDGKVPSVADHNTFSCNLTGNNPFWNPRPLRNICQAKVNAVSRSQQVNVSVTTTATNCSELNKIDADIQSFFRNIVTKAINSYCENMTTCKQKINFNFLPTKCSSVVNDVSRRRRQTRAGVEAAVVIEVTTSLNDSSLGTVVSSLGNLLQNETMIPVNNSYTVELTDANKDSITFSDIIYTCDPGHGNLGDGVCVMCPPGTKEESGSCMLCPVGTYQNIGGKIECNSCTESQETRTNTFPGATQFDDVCIVVMSEEPDEGLPTAAVAIIIVVASLAVCGFLVLLRAIQVICCQQKTTNKRSRRNEEDGTIDFVDEPRVLDFRMTEDQEDSSQENINQVDAANAEDGDDELSEANSAGRDNVDSGYHGSAGNGNVPTSKDIDLVSITDGSIDDDFNLDQHTYDDPANLKNQIGNQNIEISSL